MAGSFQLHGAPKIFVEKRLHLPRLRGILRRGLERDTEQWCERLLLQKKHQLAVQVGCADLNCERTTELAALS